ncbi:MAG: hypothetical protein IT176_10295 [Acidobacteria bacterium]|nr:hypothetical protein [Acidobacteriota bacterium]
MHTIRVRRVLPAAIACLLIGPLAAVASQERSDADKERPKLTLRASPRAGRSPLRIVLTAELIGGASDFQEFYCPSVEWEWGDGTESEATMDCDPYEPGKSEIRRHFTVEHVFRAGTHTVSFRLKQKDKVVAGINTQVQVQPGIDDRP